MTDEHDDDSNMCVVCDQTVRGTAFVSLVLFGVFLPTGPGLQLEPDGQPADFAEWDDLDSCRVVHAETCLQAYIDGLLIDAKARHREAPPA